MTESSGVAVNPASVVTASSDIASDEPAVALKDPEVLGLLRQVAAKMGGVSSADALRRSLRTMLALYDAKAQGGKPVIRFARTEQAVNLPDGTS